MTELNFTTLGLAEPLLKALAASGYTAPTPIQAQAIPPLLAGKDLLGLAETGTGKTAAFSLPILQALAKITDPVAPRTCRALILAPTRELAIQIGDSIETYGKGLNLRHTVVFGGVGSRPQIRAMDRGVDILIATPGRLLDLMSTRNVNLHRVVFFVLDEADRMLDMGFIRDVKRIVKELPKVRQSLLFSATMPQDISSLAHEILHNPVKVEIARAGKTVDRIEQFVHFVDTKSKRAALAALLKDEAMSRVIVFARTKHGADRVARGLAVSGVGAYAIHGNKSQNARQAALESFRTGKARVLVATDIAARGIDIDDISHVVNYDIPNIPESYVHRIGRTARAGAAGVAIALCAPEERAFLRDIERLTRKPLTLGAPIPGLAEVTASLPPIPSKGHDREEGEHFERGRGRVSGRRHMPATRPATTWRDTDPARPVEAGARAPRSAPRSAPHADRAHTDRVHGERPAGERHRDDRGAPRGARPPHAGADRREARPFNRDDRGGDRPRGDRPQGDRPQSGRFRTDATRGEGRPFQARSTDGERRGPPRDGGRTGGEHHRADRPQGDRSMGDRSMGDRRPNDGQRDFKRPDRAPDRSGDRVGRDRPAMDRPGMDRPGIDRSGGPSKPWDNRRPSNGEGRSSDAESRPQSAGGYRGGPARTDDRRAEGARPEGARPEGHRPEGHRPEGRRPEGRGPDARPPSRWNTGDRPRGGDRPRSAAHGPSGDGRRKPA